ncbi:MAG TPA: hypothetical protein VFQ40_05870, partial [Actinomycetota bacterium]|nr:hypothetical protein [Actinomycetota bacterium]
IVYQGALVEERLRDVAIAGVDAWVLYLLNPMATVVLAVQRALYGAGAEPVLPAVSVGWHAATLAALLFVSVGLLLLAWRSFFHRSGDFAEEL